MQTLLIIAAVRDGQWSWGLGDPDFGAVLVTGLYLVVAVLCLVVSHQAMQRTVSDEIKPRQRSEAYAWLILAGVMALLGINKQSDFQSLLTLYGRGVLQGAGLHDNRRIIQVAFIAMVAFGAFAVTVVTLWFARHWTRSGLFAGIGLSLQTMFVVIRAASFHHVDVLLGLRVGGIKFNLLLESAGLTVILMSGLSALLLFRMKP